MEQRLIDEARPTRYATRQPILAADETVIGYKLLFRTDVVSHFSTPECSESLRTTIDMSGLLGLDILCDNRLAFITCNRDVLLENGIAFLSPDRVVAEIEPSLAIDDVALQACCELKNAGYRIALDQFVNDDPRQPIVHLADYLKVDLQQTRWEEIPAIVGSERWEHVGLLASGVETRQDFEFARRAGFNFFQGYFFRKPESLRTRGAHTNRVVYLRLLQAVSQEDLDWEAVEELIKSDLTLYYRLLRFLNSAVVAFRGEVRSVRQALTLMGENEIRRWCRLAGMFEMSQGRPSELLLSSLVRARFAESLGARVPHAEADLFLVGLLSMMDAILEIPMSAVIGGLSLDEDSTQLLLEHEGPLLPVFDLIVAVESGTWPAVVESCRQFHLEEAFAAQCYSSAMTWAQALTDSI
jgi:EAL and modified HD-GYP domain-containing signal transduction protein